MNHDRLRTLTLSTVKVTPKTIWTFLEIETEAGLRGIGEASLTGHEDRVAKAMAELAPIALALPDTDPTFLPTHRPVDLPYAAAISALDQALWDVTAQGRGVALSEALGSVRRDDVPVYANINRRTLDRSPAGFAANARAAVAAGHLAIKLAPFDEARPGTGTEPLAAGLACVAAVREAVGPAVRLMLDCHWRLDAASAAHVIAAAAELGVDWIECPLPETPAAATTIAGLRTQANQRGITLAGLETGIGVDGFAPFVRAGAYDVMMPDLKYIGGLAEALRLSDILHAAGIGFSPHNPSGPVCHAASLHVCAVASAVHSLEVQFDETPLFATLVGADLHAVRAGALPVPTGAGLGVALQEGPMAQHRLRHWHAARSEASVLQEST
jgi:galactonate dehydratase